MRIAFLTDIHLNATPAGWQQQPRWCDGIHNILAALQQRVRELRVDLLVFGGDMVEQATAEAIEQAAMRFAAIPTPAIVCLGNHDLTEPDSLLNWRRAMRWWPQARLADAHIPFPDLDVFALNNVWRTDGKEPAFHWQRQAPVPDLLPEQLGQLEAWLASGSRPAILAIHAPLYPLPAELTGLPGPSEKQPDAYTRPLLALVKRHPRLRLVLAGHSHVTCATRPLDVAGPLHLAATSLTEVPYQFPLIELRDGTLEVSTETLCPSSAGPAMDLKKTWVVGRESDRKLTISLS